MINETNETTEAVYSFVCRYIAKNHRSPTIREIGAGCHLAHTSVPPHITRLVNEGRLTKQPYKKRSISVSGN